jgi:hypothetical protein
MMYLMFYINISLSLGVLSILITVTLQWYSVYLFLQTSYILKIYYSILLSTNKVCHVSAGRENNHRAPQSSGSNDRLLQPAHVAVVDWSLETIKAWSLSRRLNAICGVQTSHISYVDDARIGLELKLVS